MSTALASPPPAAITLAGGPVTDEIRAAIDAAVTRGLAALRFDPPRRLSEWAEEHFYLSGESSYVEQRWRAYPHQVAPMNAISDDRVQTITWMKSARVGFTKILVAAVLYFAHHKRRNVGLWQPTDEDSDDFCKTELEPALRDVAAMRAVFPTYLQRHKDNTLRQKKFIGSMLHLRGGTAGKNYRRLTLDVAILDELDGFPHDVENEGSPPKLSGKRLEGATFPKQILGGTPKIKELSHTESSFAAADLRFYRHTPCPECGHLHPLKFGPRDKPWGMKWHDDDPDTVAQLCPSCGALYSQADYLRVADRGVWTAEDGTTIDDASGAFRNAAGDEITPPPHIAFHIWTAYSPQTTWSAIVREFLGATEKARAGDDSDLKTFINTTLGETYAIEAEQTDEHALKARAEPYRLRTCPLGVLIVVAGIDVQDDRFEITVWGIGEGEEMWVVDYMVLDADPAEEREWKKLEAYLDTTFPHVAGQRLPIEAWAIDTGGHFTHQAYAFVRGRNKRRAFAIKGDTQLGKPIKGRSSLVDVNVRGKIVKSGVRLWFVGTDTAKDLLHGRLTRVVEPGPGYVHFSKDLPDAFYRQLTAEKRVPVKVAGGIQHRWVLPPGRRNEVLDGTVYALFCCQALDLHRYTDAMWRKLRDAVQPAVADLFAARVVALTARPDPDDAAQAGSPEASMPAAETPPAGTIPAAVVRTGRGIHLANWGRRR